MTTRGNQFAPMEAWDIDENQPLGRSLGRDRGVSWIFAALILSNLILAALAVWGWLAFGSIPSAVAFARGDRLIPDAYAKSFGTVNAGADESVTFRLVNYKASPVTVLGGHSSCSCAGPADLPIRIPPKRGRPVKITIRTAGRAGRLSGKVTLYTDEPGQQTVLSVSGYVIDPSAEGPRVGLQRWR
jgi:hypothetical protein